MTAATLVRNRQMQTAKGLIYAAVIVACWLGLHFYAMLAFTLSMATLPLALVMALAQCWLSVGVFIISHDCMHGSLAPGRPRLNSAIGATLLFLYAGFGWQRMQSAHFEHHKHSGQDGDPDFDIANPADLRRWFTTFLGRYFGWRSIIFVHTVVAIYWLVLDVPMAQIVLLYGLPAMASAVQLFYFGTFRPHRHTAAPFTDRHNARSNDFGELASLASCFHFGYHLEHHRRPDVPWWALPKAQRAARKEQAQSGEAHNEKEGFSS